MLEKLTLRGSTLLDRLPRALASELMGIVAQGETILAKNLQTLLVDTLVDVTKKEAGSEKSVKSESGDTTDSEGGGHRGEGDREDGLVEEALMQDLIKSAAEIFERLPSELSEGVLYGVLHGNAPLAALLRKSFNPSPSPDMADMLRDLIVSTASLFDHLPEDLADEVVADVMQASTPLAASLRDAVVHGQLDRDLDHVAVVSDLVEKVMDSIETRLALDPRSLLKVEYEFAGSSEVDARLDLQRYPSQNMAGGTEGSELDIESTRTQASLSAEIDEKSSEAISSVEPEESPWRDIAVKIDGDAQPNTPRTPLTSIPEDSAVSNVAWSSGISSVPHSLSTILAVLKFNDLDIATGYDVFDCDQDGRISLRDLRIKCKELALEMSAEAIVQLFQALVDTRTGHISRDAWAEGLASGDADIVLAKRGVLPDDIQLAHAVQDVIDDMIHNICRLLEPPKHPKKMRGVSFSEDVLRMQDPAAQIPDSPASRVRAPQINMMQCPSLSRNIRNPPPSGMLLEQSPDESRGPPTESPDYARPQVVTDETAHEDSRGANTAPEMTAKTVRI